jgi:hypothetical protein
MRVFQILLFALAVASLVVAAVAAGTELGDILWRAGVAALLTDLVVMKLWPTRGSRPTA